MSIIHDALKKVQQGLNPKTDATQATPPTTAPNTSAYIYESSSKVEDLPPVAQQSHDQKPSTQNRIKSILALSCAIAITGAAGFYIYKQFQNEIPQVQRLAKKSFYGLIHKQVQPDFKTKAAADLKPLAQMTINPSTTQTPNPASPIAPVTLNIHGIMSNASGNLVLINDQVYQEGDEIGGAKIIKIDLDSIKIINNGVEQTILVKN